MSDHEHDQDPLNVAIDAAMERGDTWTADFDVMTAMTVLGMVEWSLTHGEDLPALAKRQGRIVLDSIVRQMPYLKPLLSEQFR